MWRYLLALLAGSLISVSSAKSLNGFDLTDSSIPVRQIVSGGPPRDGIPALTDPVMIDASQASYLLDSDRILGVEVGSEARAYPIRILDWHEIVNDQIDSHAYAVTYCPLCGSGVVFTSTFAGERLVFGVSGLLFDSDVLLYDRNTDSLWSQLMGESVSGRLKGRRLAQLPAKHTTWGAWRNLHPDTLVMSIDTGFHRNYNRSPYINYEKTRRLFFDVSNKPSGGQHPKALVLGIKINGQAKAYPFEALSRKGSRSFADEVAGVPVAVHWEESSQTAWITSETGVELPATVAYWFAWYTFNPDTLVLK